MAEYDILIKGGILKDPITGINRVGNLGICSGKICEVGNIEERNAIQVVDAHGCYVVPGLIDYHIHVFTGGCEFALRPDIAAAVSGVTTVVDGGSAGVSGFEGFYRSDILQNIINVKAMLNICSAGQPGVYYLENMNPELFQKEQILRLCEQYKGTIVAIKVRQSREIVRERGLTPLIEAVKIAEEAGLPVVVHATDSPGEIRDSD